MNIKVILEILRGLGAVTILAALGALSTVGKVHAQTSADSNATASGQKVSITTDYNFSSTTTTTGNSQTQQSQANASASASAHSRPVTQPVTTMSPN